MEDQVTQSFDDWLESAERDELIAQYETEIAKLKVRATEALQSKRRLSNKLVAAETRADTAQAVATLSEFAPIRTPKKLSKPRIGTPVVLYSDWHIEEPVTAGQVNGLNEFNLEVARQRSESLARGVAWTIERQRCGGDKEYGYKIDRLVLGLLGDFISGYIHPELEENNLLTPIEGIEFAFDLLAGNIQYLLDHASLKRILVPCIVGNHERITKKMRYATGVKNSYALFLYRQLARHFKSDKRVQFLIAEGSTAYINVYDWTLRFIHGHEIKYGGGIGGLTIPLRKWSYRADKTKAADITHLGHFHAVQDLGFAVVNGALKGYDSFAAGHGFEYAPPSQSTYLIDAEHGPRFFAPILVGKDIRRQQLKEANA